MDHFCESPSCVLLHSATYHPPYLWYSLKIGPSQSGKICIFKAVMVIVLTLVSPSFYLDFCFHLMLTFWLCIFSFSPTSDPDPHLLKGVG